MLLAWIAGVAATAGLGYWYWTQAVREEVDDGT
jgi:hypothetical protein